uniref:C2H2-type domain-containing protein n=1 Tax=Anopheles maculatus TaxID=74869 RepID=A0A182SUB6_9DIPT
MAYPERGLIEQHVISHAVERRFVCDICNAALKRKDHLTRHKLSHIPDRPHICSICLKSFKRKEQLTLHIVIHTGEKKHICGECGKGFYRKDHLRKHTRSHIARRVKSEMSASNGTGSGSGSGSANGNAAQNNSTLAGSLMATNMQGAPWKQQICKQWLGTKVKSNRMHILLDANSICNLVKSGFPKNFILPGGSCRQV